MTDKMVSYLGDLSSGVRELNAFVLLLRLIRGYDGCDNAVKAFAETFLLNSLEMSLDSLSVDWLHFVDEVLPSEQHGQIGA